jgi:carboxyl-terminal processing protease
MQRLFLILNIIALAACQMGVSDDHQKLAAQTTVDPLLIQKTQSAALDMSLEAYLYLEEALDFIQENSIRRLEMDWEVYRKEVFQRALDARSTREVYPAIKFAIQALHDGHSTFLPPDQRVPEDLPAPEIKAEFIEGKIGYIDVPSYASLSPERLSEYATNMHQKICEIDQNSPCGWIVDLRNNTGGDWIMLLGVGPILGEGDVGAFVGPDNTAAPWHYENGAMRLGTAGEEREMVSNVSGACQLSDPNPNVAILTGGKTASAAETIVVAFQGRPGTRFFGEPTAGLTTGNRSHILDDGAILAVAATYYADRTGQVYNGSIRPDEIIFDLRSQGIGDPDMDPVMPAAVDWLLNQEACHLKK